MYFENGRISPRQTARLIVTEFLGITLLTTTGMLTGRCGREGIVALVLCTVFSMLYAWGILVICEKINVSLYDVIMGKFGRSAAEAVAWIFIIKYILFAAAVLLLIGTVVQRTLLQQDSVIAIIIPFTLLVVYGFRLDCEARGRFAEVAFYFVIIPAIIVIATAWGKCDRYNIVPFFMGRMGKVITTALWYTLLSAPLEMLLFLREHFKPDMEMKKAVCKGIFTVAILNAIYYILNVGIFGVKNVSVGNISSIELMQSAGHLESLMSLFMIISLYALVNCYGSYAILLMKKIFERKVKKSCCGKYIIITGVISCMLACVASAYGILVESGGENITQVSLEDKDYVMFMGIDYDSESFDVVYGFDSGNRKKDIHWTGLNLLAAKDEYSYMASGTPDFSHVKVIVLGKNVLESQRALRNVRKFLEQDETIADNTLIVCAADKAEDLKDTDGDDIKSMFENNLPHYRCEVYEMVSAMSDKNKTVIMPVVDIRNEVLKCEGAAISNGRGVSVNVDNDDANYLFMTKKNMAGRVINTGNGRMYRIVNNRSDMEIRVINNETIGVNVTLKGVLKNLSEYRIKKSEINEKIEDGVTDVLSRMVENDRLDYPGIYDRLAVADRGMWIKYETDREEMYDRIYFHVKCEFEIK